MAAAWKSDSGDGSELERVEEKPGKGSLPASGSTGKRCRAEGSLEGLHGLHGHDGLHDLQ